MYRNGFESVFVGRNEKNSKTSRTFNLQKDAIYLNIYKEYSNLLLQVIFHRYKWSLLLIKLPKLKWTWKYQCTELYLDIISVICNQILSVFLLIRKNCIFSKMSRPILRPNTPHIQWCQNSFSGNKEAGVWSFSTWSRG
jgi:hypothetical protein